MSHRLPKVLVCLLLVSAIAGWVFYGNKYPYGRTHRCSKALSSMLLEYAQENNGNFPRSEVPNALGLSALIESNPGALEYVVGKAGDLKAAERFYDENGFLEARHSSWEYTEGLSVDDTERALLWDRIPLGHHGERTKTNSREVILIGGRVLVVPEGEWKDFIKNQSNINQIGT